MFVFDPVSPPSDLLLPLRYLIEPNFMLLLCHLLRAVNCCRVQAGGHNSRRGRWTRHGQSNNRCVMCASTLNRASSRSLLLARFFSLPHLFFSTLKKNSPATAIDGIAMARRYENVYTYHTHTLAGNCEAQRFSPLTVLWKKNNVIMIFYFLFSPV